MGKRAAAGKRAESRLGSEARTVDLDALLLPASSTARFDVSKAVAGLLLLGSAYLLYLFLTSPRFEVHEVTVHGTQLLDQAEVVEAANVTSMSVFRVRTDELAASVEQQFVGLAKVSASARLPNRVTIAVQEEQAVVAWRSGDLYWWIDSHGNVLGSDQERGDLLVVRDVAGIDPQPSGMLVSVPWTLALAIKDALPALEELDYTREAGLIVYVTTERWPVYLGHEGDAQAKVAVMQQLVARLAQDGVAVEYIDLRDEAAPTYKRR